MRNDLQKYRQSNYAKNSTWMYLHVDALHMEWSVQMICIQCFGVSSNWALFGLYNADPEDLWSQLKNTREPQSMLGLEYYISPEHVRKKHVNTT